ncbi:hypothetical protein L195_g013641 [Trifolium pratense]|uniref:Uncharacterized protein n=1 Tax=Trifolium pratense TaxID=57577 RepID=A0A2K3PNR4_TRIPR|nr:hypothetical protein L195_g013641 [Trifolium pratense]
MLYFFPQALTVGGGWISQTVMASLFEAGCSGRNGFVVCPETRFVCGPTHPFLGVVVGGEFCVKVLVASSVPVNLDC